MRRAEHIRIKVTQEHLDKAINITDTTCLVVIAQRLRETRLNPTGRPEASDSRSN